ncbi:hypothetical protein B0H13DRAFT_1878630 [Mycena leptocephala]|nr:hypothetical protein B0H13DRAFT_1878630 [Mycena leptocephala]
MANICGVCFPPTPVEFHPVKSIDWQRKVSNISRMPKTSPAKDIPTRVLPTLCKDNGSAVSTEIFPPTPSAWDTKPYFTFAAGNFQERLQFAYRRGSLFERAALKTLSRGLLLISLQASVYFQKTQYVEAQKLYRLVTSSSSNTKAPNYYVGALVNTAAIDVILGNEEQLIAQKIDDARTISVGLSWPRGLRLCDHVLGDLHLRRGENTEARWFYDRCLAQSRGADSELFLMHGMHDADEASSWVTLCFAYAMKIQDLPAIYQALRFIGGIFIHCGDDTTAQAILDTVLDAFTGMEIDQGRADCMSRMGDISFRSGNFAQARFLWNNARSLFAATFQGKEVTSLEHRLAGLSDIGE